MKYRISNKKPQNEEVRHAVISKKWQSKANPTFFNRHFLFDILQFKKN